MLYNKPLFWEINTIFETRSDLRCLHVSQSRSCSSGKRRKPRFPSILSDKEFDSKSPFSADENYVKSRVQRYLSPIRRSISTDRANVIKTKPKIQTVDERLVLKLQFPEKASTNKSITNIPTMLANGNTRRVFSEHEEEQFMPTLAVGKLKVESKNTGMDAAAKIDTETRRDFSETENNCSMIDSQQNCSLREKKLPRYVTRISQNIEPRYNFSQFMHHNVPLINA